MKTLQEFYEEKKKKVLAFPPMVYSFSKPKYRESLDREGQETLSKYVHQIYNPRIKKLKEAEYFREEWLEPQTGEAKT